jgi:2-methylisocitrate lyase-like PEP mutase family enzyme
MGIMQYAVADNGVLTSTEMIEQPARVTEVVSIPLIVDADQAGETVADVYRSVHRYERARVASSHIEDEIPPKRSAWDGPLMPIADMQARIRAAVDARDDQTL